MRDAGKLRTAPSPSWLSIGCHRRKEEGKRVGEGRCPGDAHPAEAAVSRSLRGPLSGHLGGAARPEPASVLGGEQPLRAAERTHRGGGGGGAGVAVALAGPGPASARSLPPSPCRRHRLPVPGAAAASSASSAPTPPSSEGRTGVASPRWPPPASGTAPLVRPRTARAARPPPSPSCTFPAARSTACPLKPGLRSVLLPLTPIRPLCGRRAPRELRWGLVSPRPFPPRLSEGSAWLLQVHK